MRKKIYENKYFIFDHPRERNILLLIKYCVTKLQNIFYRICFFLAKNNLKKKKYNVTLCAIFKDEAPYLNEWIKYHLIVGVEHFYLYNNNSSDDFLSVLKPYIKSGKVTLIDFPFDGAQNEAYKECIKKFKEEAKWIGFLDLDEFVVPVRDNNIYDFLKRFNNRPAVKIYWKVFGTSGLLNRDISSPVIDDFKIAWPKYDEVGKCFYNTSFEANLESEKMKTLNHVFWGVWHGISLPPVNCFGAISQHGFEIVHHNSEFPIQINHYFTKSYDEYFKIKANRGDAFYNDYHKKASSFFYRH